MTAFKGFQKIGTQNAVIRPNNLFSGFPDTSFGQSGLIGGVPATGLVAWFNPSINITLGTGVSQWQDITGTYTLSQSTGSKQPVYVTGDVNYNYRPYLNFQSTNSQTLKLNIGNLCIGANTQYQIIAVRKWNTTGGTPIFVNSDDTNSISGRYYLIGANSGTLFDDWTDTVNHPTNQNITQDLLIHIESVEINRTTGNVYGNFDSIWHNTSTTCTIASTNYASGIFSLGNYLTTYSNGYLMDVIIYNQNLSQTDWLMLRNYFGQIYGF